MSRRRPQRRPTPPDDRHGTRAAVIAVALAVVLVAGAVALIARSISPDDRGSLPPVPTSAPPLTPEQLDERRASEAWIAEADAALGATTARDVSLLQDAARTFLAGQAEVAALRLEADRVAAAFAGRLEAVKALRPFPYDERVVPFYVLSLQLYLDAVAATRALGDLPAGDVREQADRHRRRVRQLADRVFDRGRALVDARLHQRTDPALDVRLPTEVPDWEAEGLAPGPPLADQPRVPDASPPLRQAERPSQPKEAWLADLAAVAPPPASDVAAVVEGRPGAPDPRATAASLTRAALELGRRPDPAADRELSTRARLSLVLAAEAVRAAQLAAVLPVGADRARGSARRIAVAADLVWDPALPARSSGIDRSVLP